MLFFQPTVGPTIESTAAPASSPTSTVVAHQPQPTAVSQETPVVSCDDMSHASSCDEEEASFGQHHNDSQQQQEMVVV